MGSYEVDELKSKKAKLGDIMGRENQQWKCGHKHGCNKRTIVLCVNCFLFAATKDDLIKSALCGNHTTDEEVKQNCKELRFPAKDILKFITWSIEEKVGTEA